MLKKTWVLVYLNHLGCNLVVLLTMSRILNLPGPIKNVWRLFEFRTNPFLTRVQLPRRFSGLLTDALSSWSWLPKKVYLNPVKLVQLQHRIIMFYLHLSPRVVWELHWSQVKKNSTAIGWSFFIKEFPGNVLVYLHKTEPGQPMCRQVLNHRAISFLSLVEFADQQFKSMTWSERSSVWPEGPNLYAQLLDRFKENGNHQLSYEDPFYAAYFAYTQKLVS